MAFSTCRGRPRTRTIHHDSGTPELRLKHALGMTAEPIDLCLARALISKDQHWCSLHLRWLHTLRYGAPVLTTNYRDPQHPTGMGEDTQQWREEREREYHEAIALLKAKRHYDAVIKTCIFNEMPLFLRHQLQRNATHDAAMVQRIQRSHHQLCEGLDILVAHWRGTPIAPRH